MRANPYAKREKAIIAADLGGIRERWEYGRLLLVDDAATTPAGNLRNGVLGRLIQAAARFGRPVSRREIQLRLRAARTYPMLGQLRNAVAQYGTWHDLAAAGFPPFQAPEGERPYDPRTDRELMKAHGRSGAEILPEPWEQTALFGRFDDDATLGALQRYAEEQAGLTARFAAKSDQRLAYLAELIKAVDGDLTKTYGEARAALEAPLT